MRELLLAALLLVPLAAAEPPEPVRACTSAGCVVVQDTDGDGDHDRATASFALGEQVVLNARVDNTTALWEIEATSEELAHDVDVVTLSAVGEANLTAGDGSPGFRDADVLVAVLVMDHDTGQQDALVWRYVHIYDADGDNVPDGVETLP